MGNLIEKMKLEHFFYEQNRKDRIEKIRSEQIFPKEAMTDAILTRKVEEVKKVIQMGGKPTAHDMFIAVKNFNPEVLNYLASRYPTLSNHVFFSTNVEITEKGYRVYSTPFTESMSNPEAFKILLDHKASLVKRYNTHAWYARSPEFTSTLLEIKHKNPELYNSLKETRTKNARIDHFKNKKREPVTQKQEL